MAKAFVFCAIFFACAFADIAFFNYSATAVPISCNDYPLYFGIHAGAQPRITILTPHEGYAESFADATVGNFSQLVELLENANFLVTLADSSDDLSPVFATSDAVIIYGYMGRAMTAAEHAAFDALLAAGGGFVSIVRGNPMDIEEFPFHNELLAPFGIEYTPPRVETIDTLTLTLTPSANPLLFTINHISFYKPVPINCSSSRALFEHEGTVFAAFDSTAAHVLALGDENFMRNGELILGDVPLSLTAFDNAKFFANAAFWATEHASLPCALDTITSTLYVGTTPFAFTTPELSFDGRHISFLPPVAFWATGTRNIHVVLSDTCGNSLDRTFPLTFDLTLPRATLLDPPTGALTGSGDSAIVFVQDYESALDTAASFAIIDGTDTIFLSTAARSVGFGLLPHIGWNLGDHTICIHAQDIAGICAANVLDTCLFVHLDEETLSVEIADVYVEGCSMVYTEVCVRSAERYVKDLDLDNFAFYENTIRVYPPSLEILNSCLSESIMVDIVLLLDFSTSMNDEVRDFFGSIPSFVAMLGSMNYRIASVVFNGCPAEIALRGVWLPVRTTFGSAFCNYSSAAPDLWATNLTEFNCQFNAVINDLYTWTPADRGSGAEDQYGAIYRANETLDFRPGAIKTFIMFTDERPIVSSLCTPRWNETPAGLDSIIRYCLENDIYMFPITPTNGEFIYTSDEDPSRAFYTGYPILAETTGGSWFYLWSEDYNLLAAEIGRAISDLPCCYRFRYRESQFCREQNLLVVDAFFGSTNFGRADTTYVPPCPGTSEFIMPYPCAGITTCARQPVALHFLAPQDAFRVNESSLSIWVSGDGIYYIDNPELTFSTDTLIFEPLTDFFNNETVRVALRSAFDTAGCPIFSEVCSFVVDLQEPVLANFYPPPETTMNTVDFQISLDIFDNIAGVRWDDVDVDNFSLTINGMSHDFALYRDPPFIHLRNFDPHSRDTITVCAHNIPDNPTYDYCAPNIADTCWTFYVMIYRGPEAEIVLPAPNSVSACVAQEIWLRIFDEDSVNLSTVELFVNDELLTFPHPRLFSSGDTIKIAPPALGWHNNDTVTVQLTRAEDMLGSQLRTPLSWTFYLDFAPPQAIMLEPEESTYTIDLDLPARFSIDENMAGIDAPACSFYIEGAVFSLAELGIFSDDSLFCSVLFDPQRFGMSWHPSETVNVAAVLCDNPDTCAPNCARYQWVFFVPPDHGCKRMPNPFTPNSDGANEQAKFTFPGLMFHEAHIRIFDIHSKQLADIFVPRGMSAKDFAIWDGRDSDGAMVPEGVYVWTIEVRGEIVCNGTVTVAR